MDSRHLILMIKELPRPKGEGAFCYRYSDREDSGVLAYLKLVNPESDDLKQTFRQGLAELQRRERRVSDDLARWFTGYETENMQPWAQALLREVVDELVLMKK